jgi:thiamine biosynthesis protein ThiS
MRIKVNGQFQEHPDGIDGRELLTRIDWTYATLVAEVNGRIVRKDEFLALALADGDELELVTLVGGG